MTVGTEKDNAFICRQCGACCRWTGHVWLTESDLERLAQGLRCGVRDVIDRYAQLTRNRAGLSLTDAPDGACIFLADGRCAVYEYRPQQCREFPRGWTVSEGCPGNAGKESEADG